MWYHSLVSLLFSNERHLLTPLWMLLSEKLHDDVTMKSPCVCHVIFTWTPFWGYCDILSNNVTTTSQGESYGGDIWGLHYEVTISAEVIRWLHIAVADANKKGRLPQYVSRSSPFGQLESHGALFMHLHSSFSCTCVTKIASRDSSGLKRDERVTHCVRLSFSLVYRINLNVI